MAPHNTAAEVISLRVQKEILEAFDRVAEMEHRPRRSTRPKRESYGFDGDAYVR